MKEMLQMVDKSKVDEVKQMLEYTQKGTAKATVGNYMVVLRNDPLVRESMKYNKLTGRIDIVKKLWWNEEVCKLDDDGRTYFYYFFECYYKLTSEKCMDKALRIEANSRAYHPICEYLEQLEWDGQERIRYVLQRYMGADASDFVYEVVKHFLMEALSRIYRPGCKADEMLCLVGQQGAGKSTFLKTAAGLIPPVKGTLTLGQQVLMGYFDQQTAALQSDLTVVEHFHEQFPSLTDKEVRQTLGAFLFTGKDTAKKVSSLSGGEKSRLVLAELFKSCPNFFVLDEPTNHMDIPAKETLESAFRAYTGTLLFVSHDRYFIRQVAESLLIFDDQSVFYYPFGYEHYLAHRNQGSGEELAASLRAEEQALLSGLQRGPMPERHRLREYSTEQSYEDWQLRLMTEPMEQTRMDLEQFWNARDEIQEWTDPAYAEECLAQETILTDAYTKCCLAWYDKWAEFHPEPDKETGLLPS